MTAVATGVVTGRRTVTRTLLTVALVVVAAVVEMLPVPVVVRSVFAFPVLVLVTGHSLTRLVLDGWHPEHSTGSDRAGGDLDALLRVVLPVLLGVLALLASVLLLSALGIAIGTRSAAAIVGGVGAGLSALLPSRGAGRDRAVCARISLPGAAAVVAATVVMGVALIGAVGLRPQPVLPYAQITLDDPGVVAGSTLSAAPGAPVLLHWMLRGYGSPLSLDPSVDVTVAGRVVPVTTVDAVAAAPADDGADVQHGSVGFVAPIGAGLYDLRVRVGTNTPAPSVLVLRLAVHG